MEVVVLCIVNSNVSLKWKSVIVGARQVTIIFVVSVGLFVCLWRVFLSRL